MILRSSIFSSSPTVQPGCRVGTTAPLATARNRVACMPQACDVQQAHQRTYDQKRERRIVFDNRKHVARQHRADPHTKVGTLADDKRVASQATRKLAQSHHKLALLDAVQWACYHHTDGLGFREHTQRVARALARLQPANEAGLLGRKLAGTWVLADVSARGPCGRPWPTLRSTDAADARLPSDNDGGSILDGLAPNMYLGQHARLKNVTMQWTPDDDSAQATGRLHGVYDVSVAPNVDIRLSLCGDYFWHARNIMRVDLQQMRLSHPDGPDDGRLWQFPQALYDWQVSFIDDDALLGRCNSPYQRLWVKHVPPAAPKGNLFRGWGGFRFPF